MLLIVGIIVLFIGFISSFINGLDEFGEERNYFSIAILFPYLVSGIGLIGLAEIIRLLQKMVDQVVGLPVKKYQEVKSPVESKIDIVSEASRKEIMDFYETQSIQIENIQPTKLKDFFIVVHGEEKDIVELGGFKPDIISKERINRTTELRELLE